MCKTQELQKRRRALVERAAQVFDSQEGADEWLNKPAIGLDGARPVDLLETEAGFETVEDFLGQIDWCVYR